MNANYIDQSKWEIAKIESSAFGHINIWIDHTEESASLEKLKKDGRFYFYFGADLTQWYQRL